MQSGTVTAIVCFLAAQYIRLVRWTGRWRVEGEEIPESFRKAGKPFIMTFWHGQILMMPYAWRRTDLVNMLASEHRDGQLIARTTAHFGVTPVLGSTSRGGARGMRSLIRLLGDGGVAGITPDGPRGPRMRVGEGTITLARLSGAAILPVAYAASRWWLAGSWDRFAFVKPFARGVILWGEPFEVTKDIKGDALEAKRLELEEILNGLVMRAAAMVGQTPVEPAPADAGPKESRKESARKKEARK